MERNLLNLQLGALLYDFGKIVRRAGLEKIDCSVVGSKYLLDNFLLKPEEKEIIDIIDYHYIENSKNEQLSENSLAYIVYEANNIASGIEKTKYEDNEKVSEMAPLNSIFNKVYGIAKENNKFFNLKTSQKENFIMPSKNEIFLTKIDYLKILNDVKEKIKIMGNNIEPDKLLTILEEYCLYFPANSYENYSDISYFDHLKLTTAIASCMYLYDNENAIFNYKKEYLLPEEMRKKNKFLLISGEFSGIQNFIYTITSKMAMKSLRGRSFYLELFIEHIIDEILLALNLSRANLLYSGGSQFYLLLPNIDKSKKVIEEYKEIINKFLLKEVGTKIYFEMSYIETNAHRLGNGLNENVRKENKIGEIFRNSAIINSKNKLSRYSKEQLMELFNEDSDLNKVHNYTKECKICKKAEKEDVLNNNKNELAEAICNSCKGYIKLGKEISKIYHSKEKIFIVEKNINIEKSELVFPKYSEGFVKIEFLREEEIRNQNEIHRFYLINSHYLGNKLAKNIWIGNYNFIDKSKKDFSLIEFKNLVEESKGIKRLAVLRADIDNLGLLFQNGFVDNNLKEPYKYLTLSKYVVLSRNLSDFFKRKINLILEKKAINENEILIKYADFINTGNNEARKIVIVYSGGDDVFAIGTWDDILEFSVDLRNFFKEFSSNKVTISAGIGFFKENFPIYQMAEITGNLEKQAKSYSKYGNDIATKDAVALFGEIDKELNHIYDWDTFIEKVINEKYLYIKSKITFIEKSNTDKIFVGKSKWYKMMELIKEIILSEDKRLDVARFAYTLARIENNEKNRENYLNFRKTIFEWIKTKESAKQLLTAINIIIYEERGE